MTKQNIQNGNDAIGSYKFHKQFKNSEEAWDSFKRTKSLCRGTCHRHRREHCSPVENDVKVSEAEVLRLFDYSSPSSLQQNPKHSGSSEEEEWHVRTNDLAILEMLSERKDSMRSGKFKGRSLHDALESASKMGKEEELHTPSGCSSSDLIQGSGVKKRLFSSHSSLDCDGDNCSSLSESYSSFMSSVEKTGMVERITEEEKDQVVVGEWNSDAGKCMALMGLGAILLMVFALGIIAWRNFDGYSPSLDFCYPT